MVHAHAEKLIKVAIAMREIVFRAWAPLILSSMNCLPSYSLMNNLSYSSSARNSSLRFLMPSSLSLPSPLWLPPFWPLGFPSHLSPSHFGPFGFSSHLSPSQSPSPLLSGPLFPSFPFPGSTFRGGLSGFAAATIPLGSASHACSWSSQSAKILG